MPLITKICGLSTREAVDVAVSSGADYLGFVFFPRSPRNVSPMQADFISNHTSVKKVAVIVDMADIEIVALLQDFTPDYLQLHGNETPERVAAIRSRFAIPVIKALSVSEAADLERAFFYKDSADMLLFDAKPPKNAAFPGGNGVSFDWNILKDRQFPHLWFLSGGLSCQNIREAVNISGARMVDVSSGVESSPGIKKLSRIKEFLEITALL